nr:reverse transcriptase domain-containing protein [Tanacetum cinerariifolium]
MRTRSRSRHKIAEPLRIEFPSQEDQFQEDPPEVPMADNRTMAQLLQAPTEGYEDAIVIPEIAATNFELKHAWDRFNDLLRACPHHGFSELHYLDTFYNALNVNDHESLSSAAGGNILDKMPSDCLKIIESKSKDLVRALLLDKKNQSSAPASSLTPALVKAVEPNCVTCGGSGTLPGNTITNPKEDLKGITTQSGVAYQGPAIPTPSKVVKQETEVTKDQVQTSSSQSTAPVQPSVVQSQTPISEPIVAPEWMASINLMPLFVWEELSLPELTPICMTLELADRTVSKPIGIAKDVSVKVGVFHFPADFVVVDFEPDPRVSLILGRCFLKTGRALIDVHKGELTLRIGNEAITYNLYQTSRYSANYDQITANKIDAIDMACEEYSQEVLGFSDVTASGSPTPSDDPIVSTTSPTLTPFGDSDFLLFEEVDAFLGLEDDPDSPEFDPSYYDPEGNILLLEAILNSKPSPPLPNHEQSMPSFKKELKACEAKMSKSFVDEPPEVELKDLPPHLEYAFLEGDNKLPIIIAKETFAYRRMPFGLCNAPGTFQRCMLDIFHDMVEKTMEVFMDDFSIFRNSFKNCLSSLEKMLQRCEDTKLCLNWEKSHFMVKEGIVLGHKISKNEIEVDKAKVDVITKLPHPTTVKGVWSFLGHAGFVSRNFSEVMVIQYSRALYKLS